MYFSTFYPAMESTDKLTRILLASNKRLIQKFVLTAQP